MVRQLARRCGWLLTNRSYRGYVVDRVLARLPFGKTVKRRLVMLRLVLRNPSYREAIVIRLLNRIPGGWRLYRPWSIIRQLVTMPGYRRALVSEGLDDLPGGWRLRRAARWLFTRGERVQQTVANRLIVRRYRFTARQRQAFAVLVARLELPVSPGQLLAALRRRMLPADLTNLVSLLDFIAATALAAPPPARSQVSRVADLPAPVGATGGRRLNILFVTGEFPNPFHGGGSRVSDFIKAMSVDHNIYLFSASNEPSDPPAIEALRPYCRRLHVVDLAGFEGKADDVRAFIAGVPIDIVHYEWPRSLTNFDRSLGRLHLFTYMEAVSLRLRLDLAGEPPLSDRYLRTVIALLGALKVELVDAARVDARIVVTEKDGAFLARFDPTLHTYVVNHGISLADFSLPDRPPEPHTIMYIGNYLHYPSEDAVRFFFDRIYARVKAAVPALTVYLVGTNPTAHVRAYDNGTDVIVTGRVDDFRPYIQRAAVCIAPLISGAGLRTKVIQYAALKRPCVATSIAAADLVFEDGQEVFIADDPVLFADRLVYLLQHPAAAQAMAASAYEKVSRYYDNPQIVRALYRLYTTLAPDRPALHEPAAVLSMAGEVSGKVSIIVVSYGGLEHTRACIASLLRADCYPDYEIVVVDNASPPEVRAYLAELAAGAPRVRVIFNETNVGFAAANNIGIQAAGDSRFIVLLNNDTIVPAGWLERLLRHAARPEVGLVGPVTNWTGNEARITVDYTDIGDMDAFAQRYTTAHAGQVFDIGVAAMFCVAMRREVYTEVGPLDERYGIGMFEDDDYARRVRAAGYRVICAEDVFVHHHGMASFGKLDETTYRETFEHNRRLYEEKWGESWQPYQARPARRS